MQRGAVSPCLPPDGPESANGKPGVLLFDEPFTAARLLLIGPIVVGIVGLELS
jgi:hypothetical protein